MMSPCLFFSSGKTLTGGLKAIGQNAPGEGGAELVLQSNSEYVQRIRQRLAEDTSSCQQREKRRSRFLQEQLKAHEAQQVIPYHKSAPLHHVMCILYHPSSPPAPIL